MEELAAVTGLSGEATERSVRSLEKNLLVERREGTVRALSFQESVLRCQLRYTMDSPVYIEDGVIRVRKSQET